jgi:transketolase
MRNAFADEVTKLAAADKSVVLLSGDIGNRLFDKLRAQSPNQFLNCGIAEGNMMGMAAGMASAGLAPIVYTITPFTTTRCLEQIRVDVAYHNVPVVIVGTGSGLSYASLGPTHHSLEDFAIFRAIPHMQIVAPYDAPSLRAVLRDAITSKKPTYIRIGKKGEKDVMPGTPAVGLYKTLTAREGRDVCILAVGTIAGDAVKAADTLKQEHGIAPEVILLNTVKPLDTDLLDKICAKFKTIVTVEEHAKVGGFGESVASLLAQKGLRNRIIVMGARDEFMHVVGSQEYAREVYEIDAASIVKTVRDAVTTAAAAE